MPTACQLVTNAPRHAPARAAAGSPLRLPRSRNLWMLNHRHLAPIYKCTQRIASTLVLALALALTACPAPAGPAAPPSCTDTCASTGATCGEVCGVDCGSCDGADCVDGRCVCEPRCDVCGGDDGCGDRCPCADDFSCPTCGLRLQKLFAATERGRVTSADVAVVGDALGARLADLEFAVSPGARVTRVTAGPALTDATKLLYRFTATNLPFELLENRHVRVLVVSSPTSAENAAVAAGRWLTVHVENDGAEAAADVDVALVKRAGVVAPADVDAALQAAAFDAPLHLRGAP